MWYIVRLLYEEKEENVYKDLNEAKLIHAKQNQISFRTGNIQTKFR